MVTLVRTCRQLTNRHVSASRVSFTHQRRKDIAEFRTFFGSDVAFGAAIDELAFSPSIRQMSVVGADPYLNDLLVQYCEEAISSRATKPSSFRIERRERRCSTFATWQGASRHSCSQTRRKPANACTSPCIRGINVCRCPAEAQIRSCQTTSCGRGLVDLDNIAWLLGYQHVSAFTHAFKRWTGSAPRALRQARI